MEKLPEDVKFDIFSRLPAESILEYKLVCKSWLNLLKDPSIVQIHLCRQSFLFHRYYLNNDDDSPDHGSSTTTPVPYGGGGGGVEFGLILLAELDDLFDCELLYGKYEENNEQSYKIVKRINHPVMKTKIVLGVSALIGSCNGLICLSRPSGDVYGDPTCIFNPITREYAHLPRLLCSRGTYSKRTACRIMSGFGYHPSTNEYKVVRIFYPDRNKNLGKVQVYTLGDGSGWRDKGEVPYRFSNMFGCSPTTMATHANGKLHWLDDNENIVAFDLADEEFNFITSPPIVYLDGESDMYQICTRQLCVLGGLLGIAHHLLSEVDDSISHVDIWLLKKKRLTGYGINKQEHKCWGWSKEFTIPIEVDVISLLALTKRGEVLFLDFEYSLCRYDPKSATTEKLEPSKCAEAIPHINSFVSLKALGEKCKRRIKYMRNLCDDRLIKELN